MIAHKQTVTIGGREIPLDEATILFRCGANEPEYGFHKKLLEWTDKSPAIDPRPSSGYRYDNLAANTVAVLQPYSQLTMRGAERQ